MTGGGSRNNAPRPLWRVRRTKRRGHREHHARHRHEELDADIRSFFTEVSQQWVVRFLEHRIGDTRILRLVQKWLRAGVLEDGIVTIEEKGTGQGSVILPLLSNVYLHYVFDLWAERWRRREATGDMIMVRYADDRVPRTHRRKKVRNCVRDGGRSSGAGPPCQ